MLKTGEMKVMRRITGKILISNMREVCKVKSINKCMLKKKWDRNEHINWKDGRRLIRIVRDKSTMEGEAQVDKKNDGANYD